MYNYSISYILFNYRILLLKTTSRVCDEELFSSIASLSPPLSLKYGTRDLPHNSDPINLDVICTPEPTIEIKPSSSNASFVNTQPNFSTHKTRHSPTPPPNNLYITIDNAIQINMTIKWYSFIRKKFAIATWTLGPFQFKGELRQVAGRC